MDSNNSSDSPEKSTNKSPINTKGRVLALDVLKGIAIILVILSHVAYYTMKDEDLWMYWTLYTLLDVFGPSLFVFLSAQGVVFSNSKKGKAYYDPKAARNTTFRRAAAIIFIGWIYNFLLNTVNPEINYGPVAFWYWHILQFIGFSQIITYYALKLKPYMRLILAAFVLLFTYLFLFPFITTHLEAVGIDWRHLGFSDLSNPYALIYFIVFEPFWLSPLLPWLAYPFIASVVGEWLVKAHEDGSKVSQMAFLKKVFSFGAVLTVLGIVLGLTPMKTDYYFDKWEIINMGWLNLFPNGIPEFLVHGSWQFMLYNLGMAMVLIAITYYITEVRRKRGKVVQILMFCGMTSLSIYIYHHFFGLLIPFKVEPVFMFMIWILITAATAGIVYLMVTKLKGAGTMESIVIAAGGIKKLKQKYERKQKLQAEDATMETEVETSETDKNEDN